MPNTAIAFQGSSSKATDIGKILLIVGPILGIMFNIPASNALAMTSLIPKMYLLYLFEFFIGIEIAEKITNIRVN